MLFAIDNNIIVYLLQTEKIIGICQKISLIAIIKFLSISIIITVEFSRFNSIYRVCNYLKTQK